MKKLRYCFCALIILTALTAFYQPPAWAAPVPTVKAETKTPLLTPIVEQLGQQLQTLVGTTAVNATGDESDEGNGELTPTFGTKALNFIIAVADIVRQQGQAFITGFAALPQLASWFDQQTTDPRLVNHWTVIGQDLVDCVGFPLLGALLVELLLFPLRLTLRRRRPAALSGRLAIVLTLFAIRALPILGFVGASVMLLDQNETHKLARYIILNVIYAFALSRTVITVFRGLLAPTVSGLRLLPVTTDQAVYSYRWLGIFSLLIIYGYFFGDVAWAIHMPAGAIMAFGDVLGLILVLMLVAVIVQKRGLVAALLRGSLSAAQPDLSLLQVLRLGLARHWHVLAIAYLIIGYMIAALGVANGMAIMLRGTLATLLILLGVRLLFIAVDRRGLRSADSAVAWHHAIVRHLVRLVIWALAIIGAAASWGADIQAMFATPIGQRALGAVFSIGTTIVILAFIYEVFSASVDRHISRSDDDGKSLKASARARTLLPMIRNTLFIIFAVIVGMVTLSEAGVNIGPLLAGAGVVGVAVGFGSQTLVKDFITGLFIVLENTLAIGDVVKIGDHSGVVEAISIRTVRLRDQDGALHSLPFSEVTKIINMTRDFAYAVISVGVGYNTDLEHAMDIMRAVGAELQKDPIYKRTILEPLEMWGVDKLGDYSITLMARLRTRPGKQWDVKRIYQLRLKQRFDKEGIDMPFPTVVNIQKPAGV